MNEETVEAKMLSPEEQREQEVRFGLKRAKSIDSGTLDPARVKSASVEPDNIQKEIVKLTGNVRRNELKIKLLKQINAITKKEIKSLQRLQNQRNQLPKQ